MKLKKTLTAALLAGATALMMSPANAFFGGWGPWDWFDDDDWYDYPPPGYYGGYPGYGYGYPGYGYGGYPGAYGGYPGWGGYPGYGYGYPAYGYPAYGGVAPQPATATGQ